MEDKVEINGRRWKKDDVVYQYPCTVTLLEDAYAGQSVVGECSWCESRHWIAADRLGGQWKPIPADLPDDRKTA